MTTNERKAKTYIRLWEQSRATSIDDVYGNYSAAKCRAWYYCKNLCAQHNGKNLKVVTYNSHVFTAGFEFSDPETGVCKYMHVTPTYNAAVEF